MNFVAVVLNEQTIKEYCGEPNYTQIFERVTDIILPNAVSFDSSNKLVVKKQFVAWSPDEAGNSSTCSYDFLLTWLKQLKDKFPKLRIHLQIEPKDNWTSTHLQQLSGFDDFFDFNFLLTGNLTEMFTRWFLLYRKRMTSSFNIANIALWGHPSVKVLIENSLFTVHRTYGLFRYEVFMASDTTCRILRAESDMTVADSSFVYEKCLQDLKVSSKLVVGLPTFGTYFDVRESAVFAVKSVYRSELENALHSGADWVKETKLVGTGSFKIEGSDAQNPSYVVYYDHEKILKQKLDLFIKEFGFGGVFIENLGFDLAPNHPKSVFQQTILWIDRDGWVHPVDTSAWTPTMLCAKDSGSEDQIMEPKEHGTESAPGPSTNSIPDLKRRKIEEM